MKYCTLMDEPGGQPCRSAFLEQQLQHECTDCGHSYLATDPVSEGLNFSRKIVGGGTVITSKHGPITEVHIVPHGGTELPPDLLDELDPDQFPAVSELVHNNADIGTGAIYRTLVEGVVSGESRGIAVAGFHVSRILLDANREKLDEQIPRYPYAGTAGIYTQYLERRGGDLRKEALLPWLAAVDDVIRSIGHGVVYHHHTYDISSLSPRPWDRGSDLKRPAFQLVWRKPTWEGDFDRDESSGEHGLAPLEDLEAVRKNICEFLHVEMGMSDCGGAIDYPLRMPVVPFAGARIGDPPGALHVMYDVRKDVLATEEKIRLWVSGGPWRLATSTAHDGPRIQRVRVDGLS